MPEMCDLVGIDTSRSAWNVWLGWHWYFKEWRKGGS